ncbi:MAG: alpha/beta hydrolase, partial [Pseudomonas sp.]|nr:alpha/beta hydrolase [Pseudomonas sp.]
MSPVVEEIRLSLPHIELAAHIFGPQDGLPVIALHGWLDNANSFARLAPKLSGLRIVAVDFAGHGHSDHRPRGAGYALADYAFDVLCVAEQLGWKQFALLGHSLGAIVSVIIAGSFPERVTRLALIDGIVLRSGPDIDAAENMSKALEAQLAHGHKRKSVHPTLDRAIEARMKGMVAVSREAAELLAQRGLMPVPGGYSWRSDSRLTLPSPLRLTDAQAMSFVRRVTCPTMLV